MLSLQRSNAELGDYLEGRLFKCRLSVAANPESWVDLNSPTLFTGCWLCVDAELAIEQCTLRGVHRTCGLNNPCHRTYGRYHKWVGIPGRPPPMGSLLSQQQEPPKKLEDGVHNSYVLYVLNTGAAVYQLGNTSSHTITEVKQR